MKLVTQFKRFLRFLFVNDVTRKNQFEDAKDVLAEQELYSSLSFQFIIILSAASLISSLGLMSDSTVTIVGAMLIAPLMKPIMSLSYGINTGDTFLKIRSILTLLIGIAITLIISFLSEQLLDLHVLTDEMMARTQPNLFDLGVAVAAGISAAIAMTRKSVSDSLPGVAIAVAIVPPLCVSGISLSMGELNSFFGSLLLFLINLFAITISAVLVFTFSGYGSAKHNLIPLPLLIVILVLLAYPLRESITLIKDDDLVQDTVEDFLRTNYPDKVSIHPGDLNETSVIEQVDHTFVFLELKAEKDALSDAQLSYIHKQLEEKLEGPVNLKIQFLLTKEILKYSYKLDNDIEPIYGNKDNIPRK
ncbi:MAG: putative hydrophobic protein (TIGR00271 family) [Bermanella sp.]|jgi:uncharacterized hydrophobic protein (TIGR00271 family)